MGVGFTVEPLGVVLELSESALDAVLQVICMVVVDQI